MPTFTWNVAANATGYDLWVNDSFGTQVVKQSFAASTVCATTPCSVMPGIGLLLGQFIWFVRATNSQGSGPWNVGKNFTVSLPPPSLIAPVGRASSNTPTYTWSVVPSVVQYYLWVSNSANVIFVQRVDQATGICTATTCSVTPTTALPTGSYIWWVQAQPSSRNGAWSVAQFFSVP